MVALVTTSRVCLWDSSRMFKGCLKRGEKKNLTCFLMFSKKPYISHMSHEKNMAGYCRMKYCLFFTGLIINCLWHNHHIAGQYNPLYTLNIRGPFFFHCSHVPCTCFQQNPSKIKVPPNSKPQNCSWSNKISEAGVSVQAGSSYEKKHQFWVVWRLGNHWNHGNISLTSWFQLPPIWNKCTLVKSRIK